MISLYVDRCAACITIVFLCDRDATGRIIKPAPFQSRLTPGTVARVEPNRRWFGVCRSFSSIAD